MAEGHARLSFQVLGALRVWREGAEVDPGPRQQAHLLALLLARAGQPVSTSELIDLIWGDAMPPSAVNIVQKYVGSLRRVLEPGLSPRAAGSYLQRHVSGYRLDTGGASLDLDEFRELLGEARAALGEQRTDDAVAAYEQALGKWHGPVGDGLTHEANAIPVFAAITGELLDACVEAARVVVPQGQAKRILQRLRLAAWIAPYDETVQATLVVALTSAGQQTEALSVFETVRSRLAEELGVDPGPELRDAHRQALVHAESSERKRDTGPSAQAAPPRRFVGRRAELALLRHAVDAAMFSRPQVVLVEGAPGVGKSRLLDEVLGAGQGHGPLTFWGRCQDGEGAPAMWPWIQIVRAMLDELPEEQATRRLTTELGRLLEQFGGDHAGSARPDARAQFRLYEQVTALVIEMAGRQPVALVVDDLHWADQATLHLFAHLAQSLPDRTMLTGILRDHAPVPDQKLQRLLATLARQSSHRRIALGPLEPDEVAELVRRETGQTPLPSVARSIQARTEGNPLFVLELARYLADAGDLSDDRAAQAAVPSTVRDIVRDRMSRLDDAERRLLEIAALMGRDVDVRLLSRAADLDASRCLAHLETIRSLGLLDAPADAGGDWRFAHDLVRESVVRSTPVADALGLHLRAADALELVADDDGDRAEALAHHLCAAGPLAEPARTAEALIVAARIAARRSAYDLAEKDLATAARAARGAGLAEVELTALTELTAIAGIHAGFVGTTLDHLDRAASIARSLGREREATGFLFSRFLAHSQGLEIESAGRLARELQQRGQGSTDPVVQALGPPRVGRAPVEHREHR